MGDIAEPILVDSSIYIDHLRAGIDIRQKLLPWLANGLLFNCGVVRSEVIRGFKNARLKVEMSRFFDIIPEVSTTAKLWQQVAELAWSLDRSTGGHRPLTDLPGPAFRGHPRPEFADLAALDVRLTFPHCGQAKNYAQNRTMELSSAFQWVRI
jgi:predicted nucleic acid-binding protein